MQILYTTNTNISHKTYNHTHAYKTTQNHTNNMFKSYTIIHNHTHISYKFIQKHSKTFKFIYKYQKTLYNDENQTIAHNRTNHTKLQTHNTQSCTTI